MECRLGLQPIDHEPVLPPQNIEVLSAQVIQMNFKVAAIAIDSTLRSLREVVEGSRLRWSGMLANVLVEEADHIVQVELTDIF